MSLHDDALATLRAWAAPTPAQEVLRERYVRHLEEHPDGAERSCVPDHLTASCLVLSADGSRALLTLHRKARRWFQFGGHIEAERATLWAAAARECREESGVPDLAPLPVPVQLSEHAVPFCGSRGDVHHLDVRFLAIAADGADPQVSEESLDVRWWPADALPHPDDDMVDLVATARLRLPVELPRTAAECGNSTAIRGNSTPQARSSSATGGLGSLAAADQPWR